MSEFIIGLVVVLGGGFMIYNGHSSEFAVSAVSIVLTFFYQNRQKDRKNAPTQTQDAPPASPEAPAAPVASIQAPAAPAQNAAPSAFDVIQK